jgi:outer membrane protein OmpA-like peptidoglycan-associated protein
MTNGRQGSLRAVLVVVLGAIAGAVVADRMGVIGGAQAQTEEEKKKRERERPKPPEKRPQSPPPPKALPPPPPPKASSPPPQTFERRLPPPEKKGPSPQFQGRPQLEKNDADPKKDSLRRLPGDPTSPSPKGSSGQQGVAPPGPVPPPPGGPKGPPAATKSAPGPGSGPSLVMPGGPQGPVPKRFDDIQKDRKVRMEDGGRRKVIEEPGNRLIVKQDNRSVIRHDEAERFRSKPGARSEKRGDGTVETFYVRSDGMRIVTVVDGNGRLIRRYRRGPDGREYSIIDNRRFYRNLGVGIGIGVVGGIVALNLLPPRVTIPRDRYIVDYDRASDDDLYDALDAPPVEFLDRAYSLEEIRDNYELRARMRRIDLDTINFDFGAWEVGPDQYYKLERIARAILRVLERNPEAVIMIEAHTDAVGSDEDNLSLSDRRASAVAEILSENFGVPAENLVTQGYGEQYLKVDTQGPERLNRRVTILNLTRLMAER